MSLNNKDEQLIHFCILIPYTQNKQVKTTNKTSNYEK